MLRIKDTIILLNIKNKKQIIKMMQMLLQKIRIIQPYENKISICPHKMPLLKKYPERILTEG